MFDRIWRSGKINTLWAGGAILLWAVWEVWGAGGFQIPKDKAGLMALLVAALRLLYAKDHPPAPAATTASTETSIPENNE